MKKVLLIIIIIIGFLFISAYWFFPKIVIASNAEKINCNIISLSRLFINESTWSKWWPGTVTHDAVSGKLIFHYKDFDYKITSENYNSISIQTTGNRLTINGTIFLLPLNTDTVQVDWKYSLETNSNPLNRINLYLKTNKINNNIISVLKNMKSFFEKVENIYGISIDQVQVKDTILLSSKFSSAQYPSLSKIYDVIDSIKKFIAIHNAKETNYPMLHVWQDSGLFKTTIAIPINTVIIENKAFSIKRMVPGKILVAEVKGGTHTANEALNQLGLFMSENHLSSPAIPFESLVTNRIEEKDTSKWITKIYYPVF